MWEAYPHAAYYNVSLQQSQKPYQVILGSFRVDTNHITIHHSLADGDYDWHVTAFNANDVEIAECGERASFTVTAKDKQP